MTLLAFSANARAVTRHHECQNFDNSKTKFVLLDTKSTLPPLPFYALLFRTRLVHIYSDVSALYTTGCDIPGLSVFCMYYTAYES